MYGEPAGERLADAEGLSAADRDEVAHCVLMSHCSARFQPPALLTEGWAQANQGDDPDGNFWHICVEDHGVTPEEVEEVLSGNYETATRSRSSGQPEAFGWTASGKYLTVVFENVSDEPLTVYPITAYEVPPPASRKRRKK